MAQDPKPFALVVRFTVRSGCESDFDQLVARTAAGIRAHEPGTLVYACHAVDEAPGERIFYELYRDRAAFADHEAQPHTRRFLAEREALLETTTVDFLTLTDGKLPVVPSALQATAGSSDIPWDKPDE
jgi:quinol monooxygenase YgiN